MNSLSEDKVNEIVAQSVANLSLEGLDCDQEDKDAMRRIVRGDTTVKEEISKVIDFYKVKKDA